MPRNQTRDLLVAAANELLWREGYQAMSPRDVQRASGVGQGSFYHHFTGKAELAATALGGVSDRMRGDAIRLLQTDGAEGVRAFLAAPRKALLGCKLGRLAYENAIVDEPELRAPLDRYFREVETQLTEAIRAGQAAGDLDARADAADLAVLLMAAVQGGYILARAMRDPAQLGRAIAAALSLLQLSEDASHAVRQNRSSKQHPAEGPAPRRRRRP
jgi:AcrR family transcriptional regulator